MTKSELIERLLAIPGDPEIAIFNDAYGRFLPGVRIEVKGLSWSSEGLLFPSDNGQLHLILSD